MYSKNSYVRDALLGRGRRQLAVRTGDIVFNVTMVVCDKLSSIYRIYRLFTSAGVTSNSHKSRVNSSRVLQLAGYLLADTDISFWKQCCIRIGHADYCHIRSE
jgi:hypothetical protein